MTVAANRFSLHGRLIKLFVAACFPEVASYLTDGAIRRQARDHLVATVAGVQNHQNTRLLSETGGLVKLGDGKRTAGLATCVRHGLWRFFGLALAERASVRRAAGSGWRYRQLSASGRPPPASTA